MNTGPADLGMAMQSCSYLNTFHLFCVFNNSSYLKHHRADDPDGQIKVTHQVQATNGQISHYESTTTRRTDDNYVELESENVYNTLDTDNMDNQTQDTESAKVTVENEAQTNEYLTFKPQYNNVSGIPEDMVYTPLDPENINNDAQIFSREAVTSQSMPETQNNEYFTLEPQTIFSSGDIVGVSSANNNNLSGTPNVVQTDIVNNTEGHDYFVLHPQSSPLPINKFENKMTEPRVASLDQSKKERDEENHNYFTLEPCEAKQTESLKPPKQQPEKK